MTKGPTPPPKNPFARPDSLAVSPPPETRSAMSGMGTGIKAGAEDSGASNPFGGRVATAGLGQGRAIAGKKMESGDPPPAKKNPFDRGKSQGEAKPAMQQAGKSQPPPQAVTTSSGLEVAQVTTQNPYEFAKRVQEAQKLPSAADLQQVAGENYTKAYEQQEKVRLETQKLEAQQQKIETQKAQEAVKRTHEGLNQAALDQQAQLAKNAMLAHQARELQGRIAYLRSQLGEGDNSSIHAAIEECRVQLAQIPSGLQG